MYWKGFEPVKIKISLTSLKTTEKWNRPTVDSLTVILKKNSNIVAKLKKNRWQYKINQITLLKNIIK